MRRYARIVSKAKSPKGAGRRRNKVTTETEAIAATRRIEKRLDREIDTKCVETKIESVMQEMRHLYFGWTNHRIRWAAGCAVFFALGLYVELRRYVRIRLEQEKLAPREQARLEVIASMAEAKANAAPEIVSGATPCDVFTENVKGAVNKNEA